MSLRLGKKELSTIMFNDVYVDKPEELWTYYKYCTDGGGYYVHGLWLAPYGPWGVYSWPWDLSVPSGALKDINNGAMRWGYVQNGDNKNITSNMKASFPANVNGTQRIAITLWGSANYTDSEGNTFMDFGKYPIVIKFLDDRFDEYNWVGNTGAIYEWSEDKRSITIYRVPQSTTDGNHNSWVCKSDISDTTIERVRQDLSNVYVNVKGLSEHYSGFDAPINPDTKECWKIYYKGQKIFHKAKTFENCWKKYIGVSETGDNITISNNSSVGNLIMPQITDLDYILQNKSICWSIGKIYNENDFWGYIKEIYAENRVKPNSTGIFKNTNISGDFIIKFDDSIEYMSLEDLINGTNIENITIDYINDCYARSMHDMFRGANKLKTITFNYSWKTENTKLDVIDFSGAFELCGLLEEIPNDLKWHGTNANINGTIKTKCLNIGYAFECCSTISVIPGISDLNSSTKECYISYATQAFNYCSELVTIEQTLNMNYCLPTNANMMFKDCPKLENVEICGLNGGEWFFDTSTSVSGRSYHNGNLENISDNSVEILFNGLIDQNDETQKLNNNSCVLWCPKSWSERSDLDISELVNNAEDKGWTIKFEY